MPKCYYIQNSTNNVEQQLVEVLNHFNLGTNLYQQTQQQYHYPQQQQQQHIHHRQQQYAHANHFVRCNKCHFNEFIYVKQIDMLNMLRDWPQTYFGEKNKISRNRLDLSDNKQIQFCKYYNFFYIIQLTKCKLKMRLTLLQG